MSKLDLYIEAATRQNTRQSYRGAIEHFEVEWRGILPATADSVARYLAEYAGTLATNTLRQRLAALAKWHTDQGFPGPTKVSIVRQTMRGIRALHPAQEKQAKPLLLADLEYVVSSLDEAINGARDAGYVGWRDIKSALRYLDASMSFAKARMEQGITNRVHELDAKRRQ